MHECSSSLSTGGVDVLRVDVDSTNIENAFVNCSFEPVYTCSIDYGTDPSYTNLTYSDTSSTLGQVTTIALSQDLQRNTDYYFIVSAESTSQCVRLRGTFRTGGWINSSVHRDSVYTRKGDGHNMIYFKVNHIMPLGALQFCSGNTVWPEIWRIGSNKTLF